MPNLARTLVGAAFALPLSAQDFVSNGDFGNGLTGWTQTGYSCANGVQGYDVDGRGASQSYYCSHGGQVTPPPYAPNTLDQSVLLVPGPQYEFSCDVGVYGPNANADAGTISVAVNGVEIARIAFAGITTNEVKRAKLISRFTTTAAGLQTLRLNFGRNYLCSSSAVTPTAVLDNVSIRFAIGPTFSLAGNLKVGTTVTAATNGPAGAPFAIFAAPAVLANGLTLPGVGGQLFLDPLSIVSFFAGTLDASGKWTAPLPVPNLTALTLAPTWFQGAHISGSSASLGFHAGYVFVR